MTTAVFGHHPWKVQELVDGVASGRVRLPDIQRPFVWSNAKVRDLIDSMYRGYPVGELMFWANHDGGHTRAIGDGTQDVSMQVVDGQQRLTSLYAVMKGLQVWREDYSRERIAVAFSPIHERFEVPTPIVKRSPEWIPDITTVFDSPIQARHAFISRYRESLPDTDVDEVQIETRINRLHQLQSYLFQVVQLGEDVPRETVADVFVRINSEGVNLSAADFILTWMSVFWEKGRSELEEFARDSRFTPVTVSQLTGEQTSWTPHNPFFVVDAGQLLRVEVALGLNRGRLQNAYQALRGRNPRTREIDETARTAALEKLQAAQREVLRPLHWDEFLKVVERAGFRSRAMVGSLNLMLYTYALWLVGRVRFGVAIDPLREVMARWLFMALLTGRYTSSPETAIQNDLNRLEGLEDGGPEAFVRTLDGLIEAGMPDDWWRVSLPEALVTSSTSAPAFVGYLAALNILDAEVLLSPMKVRDWMNPARRTVKGVEIHHLFPKGYLRKHLGVTSTRRINQVANYALVEWSTNIEISDKAPADYWPAQCDAKQFTGERLAGQEQIHALPADWTSHDYETFLTQRRRLMAHVTREGYRRLADPNYTPDLTVDPSAGPETRLDAFTLEELVLAGHLAPGSQVFGGDVERQFVGEITDEGGLRVGTHVYDGPTQAARELGADVDDGWEFWTVQLDGREDPVALAEVRASASGPLD
jgi:hypothetical protein